MTLIEAFNRCYGWEHGAIPVSAAKASPSATSDFGKAVAEEYRVIQRRIASRPVNSPLAESIDREVRDQIISDLDGLIKRHEGK